MKKLLLLLIVPLLSFGQDTTLIGDVDCDGSITSEDASLILQFVTSTIEELPCQENMTGLTPNQLEDMINMMSEQINVSSGQAISMIGPMYKIDDFPDFMHAQNLLNGDTGNDGFIYYFDAIKFCSQLVYDNYDDWFVPSIKQIQDYIRNNPLEEELIIPNNTAGEKTFWALLDFSDYNLMSDYNNYTAGISITGLDSSYPNQAFRLGDLGIEDAYGRCFCVR